MHRRAPDGDDIPTQRLPVFWSRLAGVDYLGGLSSYAAFITLDEQHHGPAQPPRPCALSSPAPVLAPACAEPLCSPSYFAVSCGGAPLSIIKQHIDAKHDRAERQAPLGDKRMG